ncbi:PIN domain-containing protein [Gordonia sp. VNQ95]|jgi:predicted nucleic acid-binding protein|uniref:PIN domain-containing protein n=1 Tax=Gordonia sp. VNQ95 TaxID=3156619 RepID=UPI0032B540C2
MVFTAVLDTCVLWPSTQRDFLLSLAVENLYRPLWSEVILDELEYHESGKLMRSGVDAQSAVKRAARLRALMTSAFDDATVRGWESLEGSFGLPDRDDEHVLAAAAYGGAGAIVTDNVKDFPAERVPHAIRILRPAEFAAITVAASPDRAVTALRKMQARRIQPAQSVDEILQVLAVRYAMTEAVDHLRAAMSAE